MVKNRQLECNEIIECTVWLYVLFVALSLIVRVRKDLVLLHHSHPQIG